MTEVRIDGEAEPPKRSRLRLLAGAAAAVVVLAALGATGGWLLAGANKDNRASAGRSPTPQASDVSPSPAASPTGAAPSPSVQATLTGVEFPLPDVIGVDFLEARRQLRQLRLGVQVDFDGDGDVRTVERSTPRPGDTVHAGITVKLHVPGHPPAVEVPSLLGMGCAAAGQAAADHGLTPRYEPKKAGRVNRQDPQPYAEARWNDKVKLYCDGETTPY